VDLVQRFIVYGLLGWCAEVAWNATRRVARQRPLDWRLHGQTNLWMFPVYGSCVFLFEPLHNALRAWPWPVRGTMYLVGFWTVEYAVGWILRYAIGRCPWDYSYARWHLHGMLRWDLAPVWFVFGLMMERVHDLLLRVAIPGS
jgi:uncharacterized membrane protein